MANETKMVYAAEETAISLAATLANAANTYEGLAACTHTTITNTENYPLAKIYINITDTFAAAPTAGSSIDVFITELNIDGTLDETPIPGATDIDYLGKPVGSFTIDNQDVALVKTFNISIEGVKAFRLNFKNACGQTISFASTPTTLKLQRFTYGPT